MLRTVTLLALLGLASASVASAADVEQARSEAEKVYLANDRESTPGAVAYRAHCAQCHDRQVAKAPAKTFLQLMAPDAILGAMTHGVMQEQAKMLPADQKQRVAEYLAAITLAEYKAPRPAPRCVGAAAKFDLARGPRIEGWGLDAVNSRRVPAEVAELPPADVPKLALKWAFAYPGAQRARSQPTLAMGAVFVGSQDGTVYALDAGSGCVRWTFRATAEVRTPVVIEPWVAGKAPARPLAFFGDLVGRVYAVDALSGELRWKIKADDHPSATITGSPKYHAGTLYVPVSSLEEASADPTYECCTFRGSVQALDPQTGQTRWKTYTIDEAPARVGTTRVGTARFAPSGAPIWSALAVDAKRGVLYATTGNNYSAPATDLSDAVVAFDLVTGKLRWSWQSFEADAWNVACMLQNANCPDEPGPDFDMGAGAILVTTASGRQVIVAGRKDGTVVAVDPDKPTRPLWERKVGRGSIQGGVQWGMTADAKRVYVPIADMADSKDGKVYAEPPRGGLYALDPLTGELLWTNPADDICKGEPSCDPGILAAITSMPGVVFAGHMDGRLRAYDDSSGKVLWEYQTRQEVPTVSGEKARGGSMGGGGPVVQDGMLLVNSGYNIYFHLPGNVLLAFTVEGK
ncbi:MAG TPA: PQQ-binding-like beta-propeller repeat protein [Steroidobacteraceae bacterium]